MGYELLMDLIKQVKMATRAEAGLSNYDPTRELPPLPSLSETVAAFDPSPPYLRCKNCKGRLLRGVQSFICIYCGRLNDVASDPISFKDTIACRWLLESFQLDGSEMVGPSIEESELNRGQSAPKDEISLSDFLDVKITWQAEAVNKEGGVSNKKAEGRSYVNLTGVDLDNFFSGSKSISARDTPEGFSVRTTHVEAAEIKAVTSHDNLSFFQNVQHSEAAVSSSEDKDDDAFSGWQADFQSAEYEDQLGSSMSFHPADGSGNHHDSSKPADLFNGFAVDLSSHFDSVFGHGEDLKDGKRKDDSAASLSRVDLSSQMDSAFAIQEDPKDWKTKDASAGSPSEIDFSFELDSVFEKHSNDGKTQDRSATSTITINFSPQLNSVFGLQEDSKDGRTEENSAASPSFADCKSDDFWSSMNSKVPQQTWQFDAAVGVREAQPQDNPSNLSTSFDMFQADQGQNNNTNALTNKIKNGDGDFSNEWNDFTSSTSVQDSSEYAKAPSHNQSIVASEKTLESNLFSTDKKFEEMDFGSFSQGDPIQSFENVKKELNDISVDVLSTDRSTDAERNTSNEVGQPATNAPANIGHAQPSEEVKILLSQMHDLSFMLENELSLPPKSDGFDSFQ